MAHRRKDMIGANPDSLAARVIRVLELIGWREDKDAHTHKYRAYAHIGRPYNFYVGKNGALRHGPSVGTSTALFSGDLDKLKKWLSDNEAFHKVGFHPAAMPKSRRDEEVY